MSAQILEFTRKKPSEGYPVGLDCLLGRGVITHGQHWCGIHFRWLRCIDSGAPLKGIPTDTAWRAARKREYDAAFKVLWSAQCILEVSALCIYDEVPKDLERLQRGLSILDACWRKPAKSPNPPKEKSDG